MTVFGDGTFDINKSSREKTLQSLAERDQALADIERGLEDEACGRVRDASTAFAEIRAKYQIPVTL